MAATEGASAATAAAAADGVPARRRKVRYRRRLRSRIILSYLLLGFGLTLALAVATNWANSRVEDQLVEDVMNRNIDEVARRFYANPGSKPEVAFQQMRAAITARPVTARQSPSIRAETANLCFISLLAAWGIGGPASHGHHAPSGSCLPLARTWRAYRSPGWAARPKILLRTSSTQTPAGRFGCGTRDRIRYRRPGIGE